MAKIFFGPKLIELFANIGQDFKNSKTVTLTLAQAKKGEFLEMKLSKYKRDGNNKYYERRKPQDLTLNVPVKFQGGFPFIEIDEAELLEKYNYVLPVGKYQAIAQGNVRVRILPEKHFIETGIPFNVK